MKNLKLSADAFDQVNTFNVVYIGNRGGRMVKKCMLKRDRNGGYWALGLSAVLKDRYSEADGAERMRLLSGDYDVENGEIVLIDGQQYRAKVNGNFSDAAIFYPVEAA